MFDVHAVILAYFNAFLFYCNVFYVIMKKNYYY